MKRSGDKILILFAVYFFDFQVTNFNRVVKNAQRSKKINRISVSEKDIKPYTSYYSQVLENISELVEQ